MNEKQANTVNWIGRIATWLIPIATIIYMAGAQGQQLSEQNARMNKFDSRLTAVEKLMNQSNTNSMRITQIDGAMTDLTSKRADDHDTLTRVDQTVQNISQTISEMRSDIRKIVRGKPPQ